MKILLIIFFFVGFSIRIFSQNRDIELLRIINLKRNQVLDPSFRVITKSVVPLMIITPAGFLTTHLFRKDKQTKERTLLVCSSLIISALVTTALKYSVNRQRPFTTYADIEKETQAGGPSFPSGHTSGAFSLATSVSILCPKWYVVAPCFLWASAVAYSRMDLGVHYPTDVLVGALISSGSAYLSYKLNKWYLKRNIKSCQINYE